MAWKWPGPSCRLGSRQGEGLALAALGWRLLPHEAPALPGPAQRGVWLNLATPPTHLNTISLFRAQDSTSESPRPSSTTADRSVYFPVWLVK